MAKKGRKPTEESKLPDPKVWRWCKDPECQEVIKARKLLDAENQQEAMQEYFRFCAVFGEDYCWRHLPQKAKTDYKTRIEEWVRQGRSFEGANLHGVELPQARLIGAKLQKANLIGTKLQKANLIGAKLQKADLLEAELQEAKFFGAKLQKANLIGAKLQKADLRVAELQEAYLIKANIQKADLDGAKLNGAFLSEVHLDGAKKLTWRQLERWKDGKRVGKAPVGEEQWKWWYVARDAYRRLKNYFHQQGRYDDESKAYYREKLMAKHEEHETLFGEGLTGRTIRYHLRQSKKLLRYARKGARLRFRWLAWLIVFLLRLERFGETYAAFFSPNKYKGIRKRWLGLWFLWAVAGFGERWIRTIGWAVGTFVFFGLLYWAGSNLGWITLQSQVGDKIIQIKHLVNCLYFSLVTFVTLGFGDIQPALTAWPAKILVGVEVVLGYVFLGMIVVLIARKFGR